MTDEVLDIMQPGNVVTDEQLAMIDSNADLREACQDVMMIKSILAEQPMRRRHSTNCNSTVALVAEIYIGLQASPPRHSSLAHSSCSGLPDTPLRRAS